MMRYTPCILKWRQQGSCALVYVLQSALTFSRCQGLVQSRILQGSGTGGRWLMLSEWRRVNENVSPSAALAPLKRARSIILWAQPRNSGSHSFSVREIGPPSFPFAQAICPRILFSIGTSSVLISSYARLGSKWVPIEPTKPIFSVPTCLALFLSSLLPYSSDF